MDAISAHRIDDCKRFLSDLQRDALHCARMNDVEQAGRLKEARKKRGYGSAAKAAEAIGVPYGTYSGHENGNRGIPRDDLARYARFFRVPVEWLAFGKGSVSETRTIPIAGLVGLGEKIQWHGGDHFTLGVVEVPFPLPPGCFALEARGNSQFPRVKDGELVITQWHDGPIDGLLGQEAIVETVEDEYMLKTIRRGSDRMLFDLESHNAPLMEDVELRRAGPVMMILPNKFWVRVDV
jgi:phage repressor protein C with HTH and peptisase S24 domain